MNVFGIVILAALVVDYGLGLISEALNLRALRFDVPQLVADVYAPDEYRRSQEYTRVSTRFGFVTSSFNLAVVLAFWFSGGFNFLDNIVRGWGLPAIATGIAYIAVLAAAYGIIALPFNIYHTFVIEQRFGFNMTTPRLFVVDLLKGAALGALIGIPLLAAALALFTYAGAYAWLYVWAAAVAFSIIVQYVAPVWIMPLFNKFTPMPEGELRDAILDYARSMNFPVKNVYVIDSSRRSMRSNAFFTGIGRNKRIALFDTLVKQHSTREIVSVLAHEVGHYKKRHVVQGTIISIAHTGLVLYLLSLFLNSPGLYQAFFMDKPSVYTGLIFFSLLYTPVEMLLSIVMNAVSRKNERDADVFAVTTTGDTASMANALKRLSANNLSNLTPHPFYVFLHYSHPPLFERLEAIQNTRP